MRPFLASVLALLIAPGAVAQGASQLYSFGLQWRTPVIGTYFDVVQPGGVIDFGASIRVPNEGSPAPAGPFETVFLFSTERYPSPDDVKIGRFRSQGLARGASVGYNSTTDGLRAPDVPRGLYYVLMLIDADDEVLETDETDNLAYLWLNVGGDPSGANVQAYLLDLDRDVVGAGGRVSLSYTLGNTDHVAPGAPSGNFTVGYYLKRGSNGPAPYIFLDSEEVSSLDANEYEDESEQVTIPPGTPPGAYTVVVRVDDGDRVAEWHEGNEIYHRLLVSDPAGLPYFTLADNLTYVPRVLTPGAVGVIDVAVFNRFETATVATHTGVVLSRDAAYSPDDVVIGRATTPAIRPGPSGYASVRAAFAMPAGIAPGAYVAIVVPDVDNAAGLPPSQRDYYGYRHVTVPGAVSTEAPPPTALRLGAPAPNPTRSGARVTFETDGAPARLGLYDTLGRHVAVLAEGTVAAGSHEARIPAGLAPGTYIVRLESGGDVQARPLVVVR